MWIGWSRAMKRRSRRHHADCRQERNRRERPGATRGRTASRLRLHRCPQRRAPTRKPIALSTDRNGNDRTGAATPPAKPGLSTSATESSRHRRSPDPDCRARHSSQDLQCDQQRMYLRRRPNEPNKLGWTPPVSTSTVTLGQGLRRSRTPQARLRCGCPCRFAPRQRADREWAFASDTSAVMRPSKSKFRRRGVPNCRPRIWSRRLKSRLASAHDVHLRGLQIQTVFDHRFWSARRGTSCTI